MPPDLISDSIILFRNLAGLLFHTILYNIFSIVLIIDEEGLGGDKREWVYFDAIKFFTAVALPYAIKHLLSHVSIICCIDYSLVLKITSVTVSMLFTS